MTNGSTTTKRTVVSAVSSRELDAARLDLLRRRFSVFAAVIGSLVISKTLIVAGLAAWQNVGLRRFVLFIFAFKIVMGILIIIMPYVRRRHVAKLGRRQIVGRMSILVILAVFTQVSGAELLGQVTAGVARGLGFVLEIGSLPPLLVILALVYTSAALTVPWSVREAIVPLLAMIVIVALGTFALTTSIVAKMTNSLLVLLAGTPGLLISWLRYSQLRERLTLVLMTSRYRNIQRDLRVARRIHERLFPKPIDNGPVKFAYSYEPARQIGGDYFDVLKTTDGCYVFVVLDVTGHGIAAALAVNRLHGEIKRTLAENAQATPQEIITSLNRYVGLTLADEYVFATGVAFRIDPRERTLTHCNAGHPAALLRRADRTIMRLETTTSMLGILNGDSFTADQCTTNLHPGDLLLAYTDGAIERIDDEHDVFGIDRLEQIFRDLDCDGPRDIVASLRTRLDALHDFDTDDDTLVIGIELSDQANCDGKHV